jgi:iron complex transport system ATP-binding protein
MSASTWIIESENLALGYKQNRQTNTVCTHVNLHAAEGELIALVGRNGSGKSTLLNTLAGLNHSLSGNLALFEKNIEQQSLASRSKWISYVSTEMVKVPNLSVFELVSLGRFPYTNWVGNLTQADKDIVVRSIQQVGLETLANRSLTQLSDGERQRAMIARTLAQDTRIILLDEPTAFLDLPNRFEIINLLLDLARNQKKTIIFSTHDLSVALHHADKMWVIADSTLYEGAPEDLVLNGVFDALFPETGLVFDNQRYIFIEPNDISKTIQLWSQNNMLREITCKALERNGFTVIDSECELAELKAESDATGNFWTVLANSHIVRSLYELSRELQSLK